VVLVDQAQEIADLSRRGVHAMKWPFIKLIPKNTKFGFVRFAKPAAVISIILCIASFALVFTKGLNLGIDFKGGTVVEAVWPDAVDQAAVGRALAPLGLKDVQVQDFEQPNQLMIRFLTPEGKDVSATTDQVKQTLRQVKPGVEFPRVELVGPAVSSEFATNSMIALAIAIALVVVYIWTRFELQMGFGSIVALAHDVILTLGFMSLTQLEFSLTTIAAILTIIGYSMNDTVVVFDRMRENMRKYKKAPFGQIIDLSTNETLSRTIITALTTLLALIGLTVVGGETMQVFTIVMIFGVVIGTYSSIYVAAPVLMIWPPKRGGAGAEAATADARP
jgi:preprotein translocase SecF subunit